MTRLGNHYIGGMTISPQLGTHGDATPPQPVVSTPQQPQGPLGPTIPPTMGPPITNTGGSNQ